ncbi:MAG TPA: hypothetical protein VFH51_07125 [Myxococcota bacterium]|nr:hypothetical protein [Myxococcota bacterium]
MPEIKQGSPFLALPLELQVDIARRVPPLELPKVGALCRQLRPVEQWAWTSHVGQAGRTPGQDPVLRGVKAPRHLKRAFAPRWTQLGRTLPQERFARLAHEQATLTAPQSIFDDARYSIATLQALYAEAPVGADKRLHQALMPRLVSSVRALGEATTPQDVLLRVTQLDALVDAAPRLMQAALAAPELTALLQPALATLETFLNPPPALSLTWAQPVGNYLYVIEGCYRALTLMAPALSEAHVRGLMPVIAQAAATSVRSVVPQERALDVVTALLQRVAALRLAESDLDDLLDAAWQGISTPHLSQQLGRWHLYAEAWSALQAWAQLLGPRDSARAFAAIEMAINHLSHAKEWRAPTGLIASTLQTLAVHAPAMLLPNTLEAFVDRCVRLGRQERLYSEPFENLFSAVKVLGIAVGGPAAQRACARVVDSLPESARRWPCGGADFIERCAPHFTSSTAQRLWRAAPTLAQEWGTNVDLASMLGALAPRLSEAHADALMDAASQGLDPTDEACAGALRQVQHLGGRAADRTAHARVVLDTLASCLEVVRSPHDYAHDEDTLRLYYASRNLEAACEALGAFSEVEPETLLELLDALHGVVTSDHDGLRDSRRAACRALARVMQEASPRQRPVLLTFLDGFEGSEMDDRAFQPYWAGFVSHPATDMDAAYTLFIRGASLPKRMEADSFWDLAKVFLERLSDEKRDDWVQRLLTAAWTYDKEAPYGAWRTGHNDGSWAPCLAALARVTRGSQHAEVKRLLEAIQGRRHADFETQHEVAKISDEPAHYRALWAKARPALGNSLNESIYSGTAERVTRDLYARMSPEAFAALDEPSP